MISAYLDRFEGKLAVLLVGDEEKKLNFPKEWLPEEIGEGDYLTIDIRRDAEKTAQAEQEALELLQE